MYSLLYIYRWIY